MKKFLAVLLVGISVAQAQVPTINSGTSGITAPTGTTVIQNMWDDGHVNVPLQFGFPYFGKTFTNSVMYDNGVVGFFSPATTTTQAIGCDPATMGYCGGNNWYSQQFSTVTEPSWNYMIAPLHTDMRPVTGSVYSTTGDTSQMTYRWQNVGEYYNPSNLNTFSLQIKPTGFIGVNYEMINLGQSNVSVGLTGDLSKGEYAQHFWAPAGTPITTNSIPSWNVNGTGVDQCTIDPLSSPSCPLYFTTQCTISPLYNPQCPGYAQAYFTQQCAANPLYDPQCPGYASAYLDYQCKLDPLYATQCPGYATAYFNKMCTADALYDKTCPGYAEAYALKYVVVTSPTTTTTTTTTQTTAPAPTPDSSGEIKVAVVADSNVNNVIQTTATSASPAQAATATVPLVTTVSPTTAAVEMKTAVASNQPAKEEKKDASPSGVSPSSTTQTNAGTEGKGESSKPTARQELQAKREAAAKAKAVEDGKNLAANMGKVADMEQQKQIQNVVIQAMGFTPGFDAYGKVMVPDAAGYRPYTVYNNQKTVDNRRLGMGLFGPTDRLHNEMVDAQYNRGN